jgi:hypothetical protein
MTRETARVRPCNHRDRFEKGKVSGFGYLVFSLPAPANDILNDFREMDVRFPTHELPYLHREPEKHIIKADTIAHCSSLSRRIKNNDHGGPATEMSLF